MKSPCSRSPFRSADEWKSALMTLPDNSFFELLRSVFGNIKTPFNKQRLLEDLFIFLSRDDIRKIIAGYINEQDHKVIAAVALLDEPVPAELDDFFDGDISRAELYSLVLNLEERLILYRFRDEGLLHLALNPVLEPVLAPVIADIRPLFPGFFAEQSPDSGSGNSARGPESAGEGHAAACIPDGRTLAALFVFVSAEEELFKAEGEIRKKVLDEGKKFFPRLDLELAVMVLLRLGLFEKESGERPCVMPCRERAEEYSRLSAAEQEAYWAAGVYLCLNEAEDSDAGNLPFRFSRSRLRGIASFVYRFRPLLDPGKLYHRITLKRLAKLLGKEEGEPFSLRSSGGSGLLPFEPFLAAMEMTGLLEKAGACWKVRQQPRGNGSAGEDAPAGPVIAMDTAFTFILYPEISFADALALGAFCSLADTAGGKGPEGAAVRFELTRGSAVRAFDEGIDSAAMINLLNRLSHNRLDTALGWTLGEWENRYQGAALHQGIVMVLAEELRYLAEAEPVASLVQRTLAPGVYLLSSEEKAEAAKALRKAGVDIVAQPPREQRGKSGWSGSAGFFRNSFPGLGPPGSSASLPFFPLLKFNGEEEKPEAAGKRKAPPADAMRQKFRGFLETMHLTKPERDELAARIERRLVLSEAQLEGASLRYEKLEARGLDYPGKTVIAKQAVAAGSLVEVTWPAPGGGSNHAVGIASALEKKEGGSILVLKPVTGDTVHDPDDVIPEDTIRVPLGKISLLRRIKQSIFGE